MVIALVSYPHSPIYMQDLPVYVGGVVAKQKSYRSGHILGRARPGSAGALQVAFFLVWA